MLVVLGVLALVIMIMLTLISKQKAHGLSLIQEAESNVYGQAITADDTEQQAENEAAPKLGTGKGKGKPGKSSTAVATTDKKKDSKAESKASAAEKDAKPKAVVTGPKFSHKVAAGDNLFKIASRYNVSPDALRQANELDGSNVKVGSSLTVPVQANHSVKDGDTWYSLTKKYGVSQQQIMKANGLTSEDGLQPGKTLVIPKK